MYSPRGVVSLQRKKPTDHQSACLLALRQAQVPPNSFLLCHPEITRTTTSSPPMVASGDRPPRESLLHGLCYHGTVPTTKEEGEGLSLTACFFGMRCAESPRQKTIRDCGCFLDCRRIAETSLAVQVTRLPKTGLKRSNNSKWPPSPRTWSPPSSEPRNSPSTPPPTLPRNIPSQQSTNT